MCMHAYAGRVAFKGLGYAASLAPSSQPSHPTWVPGSPGNLFGIAACELGGWFGWTFIVSL